MQHELDNLIGKILKYNAQCDQNSIKEAFYYAVNAHKGQFRASGEEYIWHPIAVANILADMEMDTKSIISSLLHDVVEDTPTTSQDIENLFGLDICELVDGVTKLDKIQYSTKEEHQIENLRKMFLAMAKDIRVIIIKLADRLHNMRTIKGKSADKQRETARETIEVYAPLAHRLGIANLKGELEDLSLKCLDPVAYREITENINEKKLEREEYIEDVMNDIAAKLDTLGIKGRIEGRAKHFYSIYRKMYTQHKALDEIYDLFAIRVIVDTVSDCYAVLGLVHEMFKPIPGRFKDYVAMPKPNMYQSLHSTLIGPMGKPLEVQIRTWEMHGVAEKGIAAHWKYKEGTSGQSDIDSKLTWVRQLLEMQKEVIDEDDFMRTLKIDLFADEVFVFTPKGDVINLPAGSTPIDFAFAIHSQIGCKMIGAKVNGKIVPIDHILQNGDIIEVLTSASMHGPSRDWLKIVKTSQARNKINQWFKKERREENIEHGKDLLEHELRRHSLSFSQLFRKDWVEPILKRYTLNTIDDLYASIGYGGLTAQKVVIRLRDEYLKVAASEKENTLDNLPLEIDYNENKVTRTGSNGVVVHGIDNCLVRLSRCCTPIPGDDIIGFITRGRGVSVHRRDCPNMSGTALAEEDLNRFIDVSWEYSKNVAYLSELQIDADTHNSLLTEIVMALSETKLPIKGFNSRVVKSGVTVINVSLEITSTKQLDHVIRKLESIKGVYSVTRNSQ